MHAVYDALETFGERTASEEQHGGLSQGTASLVRARNDQVSPKPRRVDRQVWVEAEMRSPRFVHDEGNTVGMRNLSYG